MRKPHCSQGGGVFVCGDGGNAQTPRLFSGMTGEGLYGQEYLNTGEDVLLASDRSIFDFSKSSIWVRRINFY
jgi:hypothetical protein